MVGCAFLLRPSQDALQPLGALGEEDVWQRAFETLAAAGGPPVADARLDLGQGAPLGSRRKRGALPTR